MRVLVLGGTTEASELCRRLAGRPGIAATLSLAGRTAAPAAQPVPVRSGGFGGAEGLARYLRAESITVVVDATHPFAAQMSRNAARACIEAGVPLVALVRPPWLPQAGDRWLEVDSNEEAAAALGAAPRRVFLSIGRLGIADFAAAPQHAYLVRSIEPPEALAALLNHRLVLGRGPFDAAEEAALLAAEEIDVLVSKNAGGRAPYGKIEAARRLGLPVVMRRRPERPDVPMVTDADAALAFLAARTR